MKKSKKILALVLASSMVLSALVGATIFSVSAAEEFDYDANGSIDSAEEYVDFVKKVNNGDYNDRTHRNFDVNVDLDLSAYSAEEVVIKELYAEKVIDFHGHTVSGIVREVTVNDHLPFGLIADKAGNYAEIHNIKLKDCSLTVTTTSDWNDPQVSAVLGVGDRSFVHNVELENVTIKIDGPGKGFVGVAYGQLAWNNFRSSETDIVLNNVLIDAPNARVGFAGGRLYDDCKIIITKLLVANTTVKSANEFSNETYHYYAALGNNSPSVSVKDGAEISVSLVDNAIGYRPGDTGDTPDALEYNHGYIQFRMDDDNTFAARLVVSWDEEVIAKAKEISLKLTFEGDVEGGKREFLLAQSKAYTTVIAGDKEYVAPENSALLGFTVTNIPYGKVTKITATLVLDGEEVQLGSTTKIPASR